jgi:hypothetical protein
MVKKIYLLMTYSGALQQKNQLFLISTGWAFILVGGVWNIITNIIFVTMIAQCVIITPPTILAIISFTLFTKA